MSIEDQVTGERIGHVPEDPEAEQNGHVEEDERSILLGQLRQMHQEAKSKDYKLDLEVPGFQGKMVARFKPYNISKSEKKSDILRKRMEAGEAIMLDAACDTIVDACAGIYVRVNGELKPLDDEEPVVFNARLGELLGISGATTGRKVIKALFPTEHAITAMAIKVNQWLTDVTQEVDEEFLGE